jgi:exo-1,4-beta-D-glucosaminidase
MKKLFGSILLFLMLNLPCVANNGHTIVLNNNWVVQNGSHSYKATLPATAMGILLQNGVYKSDLLNNLNYKQVNKADFDHPWLFRNHFRLPELSEGQHVLLHVNGISYSANILVNEKLVASRDTVRGPFRQFTIDITKWASTENDLTIQIFRAQKGDFNLGFVDWNPRPADGSMGIFREISIEVVNDVRISNTYVQSKVNTSTLKEAWLTVKTQLTNYTDKAVKGSLIGDIDSKYFYIPVTLKAHETKAVTVTPEMASKALHIDNPRLWWCNNMGNPDTYILKLEFDIEAQVCSKDEMTFGIREIKSYKTPEGYLGFTLNGKPVLVRGAGWTDDIFMRDNIDSYEKQLKLVKDMNLNAIRLESFWGTTEEFFNICDRQGIMVLPGWSCQWEWGEYSGVKEDDNYGCVTSEKDMNMLANEFRDQVLWLRNHPSVICWFVGSDKMPKPELEKKYRSILASCDDRPYIISAKSMTSSISGASGTKMEGPYEYVGPKYWFEDTKFGGAYGFNTETGIGAQLPVKESLMQMIPQDKLWPIDNEYYNYHCTASTSGMNNLQVLTNVINNEFGEASNLDDYLKKADMLNYDGTRSMFEAFRVNRPHTTGIIQWMLNSAWPSLYWQLYDYYGIPTAAYYSVKSANEPQQLIYNYKDHAVYAVNESNSTKTLSANLKLYDLNSKLVQQDSTSVSLDPFSVKKVFTVNGVKDNSFLFLKLKEGNKEIAVNNYCLSEKEDAYDYDKSNWFITPMTSYSDYKKLSVLPATKLELTAKKGYHKIDVTIKNLTDKVSYFNRLALKVNGSMIKYAMWNTNYVTLQPGETITVTCNLASDYNRPTLTLTGWNTEEQSINL